MCGENQKRKRIDIRLSLKTPYLKVAKSLAQKIHAHLTSILENDKTMDPGKLRRRLNRFLQLHLNADHNNLTARPHYGGPEQIVDLTHEEMGLCNANMLRILCKTEESLAINALDNLDSMISDGILDEQDIANTDNFLPLIKAYFQTWITYYKIIDEREKGNYLPEEAIFSSPSEDLTWQIPHNMPQQAPQAPEIKPEPSPGMLYSEALKRYSEAKVSNGNWKVHTVGDHKNRLEQFLTIIGDLPIKGISREIMRKFQGTLRRLPPNRTRSQKYKNKSIEELLALNVETPLNIKTVNITVEAVASLLEWCIREGYLNSNNPAKNLQIKDTRNAIELREAFSMDDLTKIFNHEKFAANKFKLQAYFWIPLIALYTGMRLEEIAQLHCADINQVDGIWVFDVNDRGIDENGFNKSVKNINAVRVVPIHPELENLGILSYHQQIKTQNSVRMFPELKRSSEPSSKYGKQPGKQFKAVAADVLENVDKKSFHSLRHTFADFYKQRGLQTDFFRQLYGHDNPALAIKQYGRKFPAKLLYNEVISKLDYELDLSHLKSPQIQKK